jgi:flagellar biosynthesis protein FlhA
MDGASKFVRGDAVAGLIITAINIVGGLIAGLARDHMPLAQAVEAYTVLTIGDGLVAQMPALLVSTARCARHPSRGRRPRHSGRSGQIFGSPRALRYASPGVGRCSRWCPACPRFAFAPLAIGAYAMSRARAEGKDRRRARTSAEAH